MTSELREILQPYIFRFKQDFSELEEETSIQGKTELERREYVKNGVQKLFSEDTIDYITENELIDLLDSTSAMSGYVYDSATLLENIGLDNFLRKMKHLLYGGGDLAERYAGFINGTKNAGPTLTSELLCSFSPDEYACLNGTAEKALKILGLDTMTAPKTGRRCGEYYLEFNAVAREILTEIRKDPDPILHNADYIILDYFLYSVKWADKWQMVDGKGTRFYLDNPTGKYKNIVCVGSHEIAEPIGEKILTISDPDEIYDLYEEIGKKDPDIPEIYSLMIYYFVNCMDIGDLIIATQEDEVILAIGIVRSDAKMDKTLECPLYREVCWIYPEVNQPIPEKIKDKLSEEHPLNGPLVLMGEREVLGIYGQLKNNPSSIPSQTHQYWSLLPSSRMEETYVPLKQWDVWQDRGIIGIPWEMLAEKYGETLFDFSDAKVFKKKFSEAIEGNPLEKPASAYMPYDFLFTMEEGDTVVIPRGRQTIIGQARVVSGPKIDLDLDFPIYRKVTWEVFEEEIPVPPEKRGIIVGKRLKKITKEEYEALFRQDADTIDRPEFTKMNRLLRVKNQVILYGPPGTGKTYTAQRYIAAHNAGARAFVTFHPSFAYEDFIEGLRPRTDDEGRICYEIDDGIFKTFCRGAFNALMNEAGLERRWEKGRSVPTLSPEERADALAARERVPFFMVIDEINRGDIPRIFGELITLLEKDKRLCTENELVTTLPYSKTAFGIPPNLFIIGTMNTADRSIALLDIALRRRFGFIEVMPDYEVLEETLISNDTAMQEMFDLAVDALRELNTRITRLYDRDHQIGHSYLMKLQGCTGQDEAVEILRTTWECEVIPLLQEYFYDSPQKLRECVGSDVGMPDDEEGFIRALADLAPISPDEH